MNKVKSSIKKNYVLNLAYQIMSIIMPFITTPYISRVLHADGIGAYSYTVSTITYIGIFASLGMTTYGQLEVAKARDDREQCSRLFWGILVTKCITTFVAILIYYVLTPILGLYHDIYRLMIIYLIAQMIDFTWFFQGFEEFGYIVIRNIAIKTIGTICIFLFVKHADDILLYTLIIQGTALLGNALLCPKLTKYLVKISFRDIKLLVHIQKSMVYFIPTIATSVYTLLDKSMIGWLTKSAFENGYYEQAHKIEQIVVVVVTSINVVTLPRIVYLYNEGLLEEAKLIIKKSIRYVLGISFPMCIGLSSVSGNLIPLFLGQGFEPCILLLRVFSVLIIIVGLSNLVSGQCLTATGRQKDANVCVIIGAFINFILNIFLIPKFGSMGAAVATVCAETIILFMFLYYCRNMINIVSILIVAIRYLIFSFIMGAFVFGIGQLCIRYNQLSSLLMQIIIGGSIYLVLMILWKDELIIEVKRICRGVLLRN